MEAPSSLGHNFKTYAQVIETSGNVPEVLPPEEGTVNHRNLRPSHQFLFTSLRKSEYADASLK